MFSFLNKFFSNSKSNSKKSSSSSGGVTRKGAISKERGYFSVDFSTYKGNVNYILKIPDSWKLYKDSEEMIVFKANNKFIYVFKRNLFNKKNIKYETVHPTVLKKILNNEKFEFLDNCLFGRQINNNFFIHRLPVYKSFKSSLVTFWPVVESEKELVFLKDKLSSVNVDNVWFYGKKRKILETMLFVLKILHQLSQKGIYLSNNIEFLFNFLMVDKRKFGAESMFLVMNYLFSFTPTEKEVFIKTFSSFLGYFSKIFQSDTKSDTNVRKKLNGIVNELKEGKIESATSLYYLVASSLGFENFSTAKIYLDIHNIETSIYPFKFDFKNLVTIVETNENVRVMGAPFCVLVQTSGNLEAKRNYLKSLGFRVPPILHRMDGKANQTDDKKIMEQIEKDLLEQPVDKVVIFSGDSDFIKVVKKIAKKKKLRKVKFVFVGVSGATSVSLSQYGEQKDFWEYVNFNP